MAPGNRQQNKQPFDGAQGRPFAEREKRTLTLRADRIDAKHLIDGEPPSVEAEHKRTVSYPTHAARFFGLAIGSSSSRLLTTIRVQLNHGNPAGDEARLAAIAEDLLSAEPDTDYGLLFEHEPQSRRPATNEGGKE